MCAVEFAFSYQRGDSGPAQQRGTHSAMRTAGATTMYVDREPTGLYGMPGVFPPAGRPRGQVDRAAESGRRFMRPRIASLCVLGAALTLAATAAAQGTTRTDTTKKKTTSSTRIRV